jgi:hypothetical protein
MNLGNKACNSQCRAPRSRIHGSACRTILRVTLAFLPMAAALGLDGGNSLVLTTPTGINTNWKTFEVISGDDALGSLAKEGFVWTANHDDWDGLGAYRHDLGTLRVFINHEANANSTFTRVDLDLTNLRKWVAAGIPNNGNTNQVSPPGPVVKAVSRGWLTLGSGSNPLNNPCSANVWMADTFGPGRGFADTLYLTGEETTGGGFWVMDVATRTLYSCPGLGTGKWENASLLDTGRTDTVALILGEDNGASATGTAPLRLYVGLKDPAGNFLQRNGLAGGSVYHWDPGGSSTNGTMSGIFAGGNGTEVQGTWVASAAGAALFSKLEDEHVNMQTSSPGYGREVAFASQNQAVFTVDLSGVDFVAGNLGVNRDSPILVLFQQGTQAATNHFGGMDNLVWSGNGNLYVTEDDGEGDIWQIDVGSLKASYAALDFTPDATQVFDILDADNVTETSGIIDISESVGYAPGNVFLASGQNSVLANNQLVLMVAPGAIPVSDYLFWMAAYPSLSGADLLSTADPDGDGVTNFWEYACNLNPSMGDNAPLEAGSGTAGLPLVELRNGAGGERLVIEYLRRTSAGLAHAAQFGDDLDAGSWGLGGVETISPIDPTFERVVREDIYTVSEAPRRFARLRVELAEP